tara:strand:- start:662 stop:844 length:183 start_codon:yes stop_codon:yes gene_type:complete
MLTSLIFVNSEDCSGCKNHKKQRVSESKKIEDLNYLNKKDDPPPLKIKNLILKKNKPNIY